MMKNVNRLVERARKLNVILRPHLKTAKSIDIARRPFNDATGPITVSTLAEVEVFHRAGFSDILYAVGVTPAKLVCFGVQN